MLPNINNNTAVHTRSASDIGKLGGQVSGPTGLPAIGASVTAYKKMGLPTSIEKSKGYTANSIILLDGHYTFDLPSGVYRVIVAYPDGKSQIMDNYAIWSGSISSLNFKHG